MGRRGFERAGEGVTKRTSRVRIGLPMDVFFDGVRLWHALVGEVEDERLDDAAIADGLQTIARLPLHRRVAFVGPATQRWSGASTTMRVAILAVLEGSRAAAALRLAVEALDDEDEHLRAAGMSVLAAAAERDPLRWCHALFHPRVDVRLAAIEGLPSPVAGKMLPWLRLDPVHGDHPIVLAERVPVGLALALWRQGRFERTALADLMSTAAPDELIAVLRGVPQRSMARVSALLSGPGRDETPEDDADVIDEWVGLWLDFPDLRDALEDTLVDCLDARRDDRDREALRLRIGAGLVRAIHADPAASALATLAIACDPTLLSPGRWTLELQRKAARELVRYRALRRATEPKRITPLLASDLVRREDGSVDVTVALGLLGWFGARPRVLERLMESPTLDEVVARTPSCWSVAAGLDTPAVLDLVSRVGRVDRAAMVALITEGLPQWLRNGTVVGAVVRMLEPKEIAQVLADVNLADPRAPVELWFDLGKPIADRLDATQVPLACAPLLQRVETSSPAALLVAAILANRSDKDMRALPAGLDRVGLRALVDSLQRAPDVWSLVLAEHRTALLDAIERQRGPGAGRHAYWSAEEHAAIRAWVAAQTSTDTVPFQGLPPEQWIVAGGRTLAGVMSAVLAQDGRARADALGTLVAAIRDGLARSDGLFVGVPSTTVADWISAEAGVPARSGLAMLMPLLVRRPELAVPTADILAALIGSDFTGEALSKHVDALQAMAPDICIEARRRLGSWSDLPEVPLRDGTARPWLDEADQEPVGVGLDALDTETVQAAVTESIRKGREGQALLLQRLLDDPPPAAEVIARSVARWTDSTVLQRAEAFAEDPDAPPWLRFRVALGLAQTDVTQWRPLLFELACAPLPQGPDGPTSWFSTNDWDGLLAVARLDAGESRARRWLRRMVRAVRPTDDSEDAKDAGTLEVATALATSPHPHAHRRAVPLLLGAKPSEVIGALRRAMRASWSFPAALRHRIAAALGNSDPEATTPALLEQIVGDPEALDSVASMPPHEHPRAVQTLIDAAVWTDAPTFDAASTVLQVIDPSDEAEAQWRRLLELAPSGPARTQAVAEIRRRGSRVRDDKLARVAHAFAWGIRTSREVAGTFYDIHMTTRREDLGFARAGERAIHVSPVPILADHPEGRDVVEGLILHELGHHMYHHDDDGRLVWRRAQRHGLHSLLNLVADEHLERRVRALDPEYGDRLKRLATYAFQFLSRDVPVGTALHAFGPRAFEALNARPLEVADAPDAVRLRSGTILSELDRLGHPMARFVRALRMGMGNRTGDPQLERALALFKGGFRHADMAELLDIAKQLAQIYGLPRARVGEHTGPGIGIPGGDADLLDIFGGHETLPDDPNAAERAGLEDDDIQREIERIFEAPKPNPDPPPQQSTRPSKLVVNVGTKATFDRIDNVQPMKVDPAAHRLVAGQVRRHALRLREDFERLGLRHVAERARLSGRAFDRTRAKAVVLKRDPRMLVARRLVVASDLFLGVAVDCSGSMVGDSIDKARRFGVLIAEAARGMTAVDARFIGFTDRILFDAGDQRRCAVSQLQATGGNNDAAALMHVAGLAKASRRRAKLLVMISDGLPTECSTTALRTLVDDLTRRHGMLCAQVAVKQIHEPCFKHYVEVLSPDLDASTRRFGEIVSRLAAGALRG